MADEQPDNEILYLACTHPTMKWGVPFEGLCINIFCMWMWLIYIAHFNPLKPAFWVMVVLFPMIHVGMKILADIDPNMFRIARLALETRGIQLRGVSVLWSMPWRMRSAKDLPSAV